MDRYFFELAALPYLEFNSSSPLTIEEFLRFCKEKVATSHFEILYSIAHSEPLPSHTPQEIELWRKWEQNLTNETVEARREKLQREESSVPWKQEIDPALHARIQEIVSQSNPLNAEIMLLKKKWNYYEEIGILHYFDITSLAVYLLKLQILIRKDSFSLSKGKENFKTYRETLYDNLTERIASDFEYTSSEQE